MRFAARTVIGLMALGVMAAHASDADTVQPLVRAHAHNDYRHARPLLDALDHGFCSVEADVYLVDGQLLVAHDLDKTRPERTLEALYLDPLRERVRANGGRVFRDGPQFSLLIDIKSDAEATYAALHKVFESYAGLFTRFEGDDLQEEPVLAVISGARPVATIAAQPLRYAAIDGRMPDLESDAPASLVPWISASWRDVFEWGGRGAMPEQERAKLDAIVAKAHAAGRRVRFWGLPWGGNVWPTLYEAGVDLINADNLPGLQRFLLQNSEF